MHGEYPRFVCAACGVKGYRIGESWPPLRIGQWIHPAYATCEGAKRAKLIAELRKHGVEPPDEALTPAQRLQKEMEKYGID